MPSERKKEPSEQALAFFDQALDRQDWNRRFDRIAQEAGTDLGERLRNMDDPAFRIGLADALGKASSFPSSENLERMRQTLSELTRVPPAQTGQGRSPAPTRRRRAKRIPVDEHIARRVLKRQRGAAIMFLKAAGLPGELKELVEVEKRIGEGTHQAGKHAAFSARNLMQGVADQLFPPASETWHDRDGREHSLGAKDHKNRLIAYVSKQLEGRWEAHEFRAFIGTMDVVMRWTGSGPHGAYKLQEGEYMYMRMLDALAVLARAHAAS